MDVVQGGRNRCRLIDIEEASSGGPEGMKRGEMSVGMDHGGAF